MSMLDDLIVRLDANTSLVDGTDLFANFLPPEPDEVVGLYRTALGGQPTETYGGDGRPVITRTPLQIRARAGERDEPAAQTLLDEAWQELVKIANEDVNGTRYLRVSMDGDTFQLMTDGDDRVILAANLTVSRQQ